MKITTCNDRALNAPSKKRLLKQKFKSFESKIILVQEIKLNKVEGIKLDKMLGLWGFIFQESMGASGVLGTFWNPRKVSLVSLKCSNNWISVNVQILISNLQFILINVYGLISYFGKKNF